MDADRPQQHRNNNSSTTATSTSELFICFTSRLSSSSSMKITSKSILSPGRARDSSQISLSTSLSRRLRNSGSIKGGQASPMFPATNGKKRGCSFENPEPSSPKVTCIGQVRVKTKKQGKKIRARSKSRREVSFRKPDQGSTVSNSTTSSSHNIDGAHFQDYGHGQMSHSFQQQECLPHRNQRWVHLPITICEALRTFGAEFNCFLPCRSSCMAREKAEKASTGANDDASGSTNSCGAVFARWLVAEKIELVVGEEDHHRHEYDEEEEDDMPRRSQRRHVFEDIVIGDENFEEKNEILEEEEARVSICIPPKNALLLMRCRSDPVKMAALANRFWECPPPQDGVEDENEEHGAAKESHQDYRDCQIKVEEEEMQQTKEVLSCENLVSVKVIEEDQMIQVPDAEGVKEADLVLDREEEVHESQEVSEVQEEDLQKQEEEEKQVPNQPLVLEEETVQIDSLPVTVTDPEKEENANAVKLVEENEEFGENEPELAQEEERKYEVFDNIEESRPSLSCSSVASEHPELEHEKVKEEQQAVAAEECTEDKETLRKVLPEEEEETVNTTHERSEPEETDVTHDPETGQESKEIESQKQQQQNLLPDCLLLMMCEPKLSMEVSKETWVCSTDFIRWQPSERKPPPAQIFNKTDSCDEPKKRISIDTNPAQQQHHHNHQLMQPPRSSCSFPAAPPLPPVHGAASMNSTIEQKLLGAKPSYEPFVLTRCKSEPMRSSAKLASEACFWKNRKLEPHRPGTLGVGAAGVGF